MKASLKKITQYVCNNCGDSFPKWQGKCESCGSWNTLVEMSFAKTSNNKSGPLTEPITLAEVDTKNTFQRFGAGIDELDRVLGGGVVPGSIVLIGGDPGIGKSTLVLQMAAELSRAGKKVLYVAGEESPEQIKLRSERLKISGNLFQLLPETDVDLVAQVARRDKPDVLIIDSIQTIASSEIPSAPGGVAQITYTASVLQDVAKKNHIATFLIGHVTKEGSFAGPKVLEHLVDTVLYFEGEKTGPARILRSHKNRFGATSEMGIFEMVDGGLSQVKNPSAMLLSEMNVDAPGTVVFPALEGTRPLLVEIQALTSTTSFPSPRRVSYGTDINRLHLLLAVLSRRLNLNLATQDVYINIVGGLKITEPAADLAICLAIYSALKGIVLPKDLVVFGEVGLSGEIRKVRGIKERLVEAKKLGYTKEITPETAKTLFDAVSKLKK